jgi:hypothetical protein
MGLADADAWPAAEVPEPPRLADKDEQGPGGFYWKFDAKIKQLEEYADANSKYLGELHRRYVAPHAGMHAELVHEIRAQQAHHHATVLPQLDALRASVRALQRDMHLTMTKVDVVEGWVTWVLVCCAYLAMVYVVLAVAKAAWLAVRRVLASSASHSATLTGGHVHVPGASPAPVAWRRSMSSAPSDQAATRRFPLHKSTIHSLDLPDPRSRALCVHAWPGLAWPGLAAQHKACPWLTLYSFRAGPRRRSGMREHWRGLAWRVSPRMKASPPTATQT